MPQDYLLEFPGRHRISFHRLLPGKFLNGRKSLALRSIRDEDKGYGRACETGRGGENEAPFPSQGTHNDTCQYECQEFADIGRRTENAVISPPLRQWEPAGEIDDARRRSHRLDPAVGTPQDEEHSHHHNPRDGYGPAEEAQKAHHQIYRGGDEEACGHEPPYIAIISYESVHEFAEGIDQEQCGPYQAKVACREHSPVNEGLLDHAQCHPADVIEAVYDGGSPECPAPQPPVFGINPVARHSVRRGLAYSEIFV